MKIIRAEKENAEEILKLQKNAYQSEAEIYNDFSIPPLTQTLENIQNQINNQIFLIAIEDEKIIGSVRAYEKYGTCYIGRLIVNPDKQNQGIGTLLMDEIEKYFSASKRYELFTGSKSEKNISLYKKLGYNMCKSEHLNHAVELIYMEKIKNISI